MRTADSNTSDTAADPVTTHTPLTPALIHSSLHSTHRQRSATCTEHHAPQNTLSRRTCSVDLTRCTQPTQTPLSTAAYAHTARTSLSPALLYCSLDSTHRERSATCTGHHAPPDHALAAYLQRRPELMLTADANTSEHCCTSTHRTHSTDTFTTSLQPAQHAPPALSHVHCTSCAVETRTGGVPAASP